MQRINRPYVGIPTFLRAKIVQDIATLDASIAVLGVPFDEGSPFLPGSRMGPRALRSSRCVSRRATASTTSMRARSTSAMKWRQDSSRMSAMSTSIPPIREKPSRA
jgi:arginase family enzyme